MSLVWGSTLRDRTQVDVLNYLANCGDDDGGNCFPGIPRIARFARCSERTVIRTIAQLEQLGFITVLRGDGRGNRSEFQLNVALLKECQDVTLSVGQKRVIRRSKKGDSEARKGDIGGNPPHPLISRTVREPSGSKNIPPTPIADAMGASGLIPIAVEQVMRGCKFTARRLRLKIRAVIEQQVCLGERSPAEVAAAMVDAWQRYTKQGLRLRVHMKAAPFFEEGYWLTSDSWYWDNDTIKQERLEAEARVGSLG